MNEFISTILIIPFTLLCISIIKRLNVKKKPIETKKEETASVDDLSEYYNLHENATTNQKKKVLLFSLAKNYEKEYNNLVLHKRYYELQREGIVSEDIVKECEQERNNIALIRYLIESECTFYDYETLDKEARNLTKISLANSTDVLTVKFLSYLSIDPMKVENMNEFYTKFKNNEPLF